MKNFIIAYSVGPVLPATLIGLTGLLFYYLYLSYKTKKRKELAEIQSMESDTAKIQAIERQLNEFGTTVDTSDLSPEHKFDYLKSLIRAKTLRFLISSIVLIAIAIIISFVLTNNQSNNKTIIFKELSLHAFYVQKNGVKIQIPSTILEDITSIESDVQNGLLSLQFSIPDSVVNKKLLFQFYFNNHFSKKLGSDRANPDGWSVRSSNGNFQYTSTEINKELYFNVSLKNSNQ